MGYDRGAATGWNPFGRKTPSSCHSRLGRALRHFGRIVLPSREGGASGRMVSNQTGEEDTKISTAEIELIYQNQEFHLENKMNILATRQKTHGNFLENAGLSQSLKDVMRSGRNWQKLTDMQKESLEMVALKISRILSGDQDFRDHWDDIVGYARLAGDGSPTNLPTIALDIQNAISPDGEQK